MTTLGSALPAGLAHHLADEEAEHALLAAAVRLDLLRVGGEDGVDDRRELGLVADGGLRQVVVRGDRALAPLAANAWSSASRVTLA